MYTYIYYCQVPGIPVSTNDITIPIICTRLVRMLETEVMETLLYACDVHSWPGAHR